MLGDPLEFFWLCAHTDHPVLTYDQFRMIPADIRNMLINAGLLKEGQPSRTVECNACDEGHVEEVQVMEYPDGKRRFFIACPECTCVEVNPQRLRQWIPDYSNVAKLVSNGLNCFGGLTEIVPNRIWKLGESPLGHRPIPIWLARYVTRDIIPELTQVGDGVLLVLGENPRFDLGIHQERVINIREIMGIIDSKVTAKVSQARAILQSLTDSNSLHSPYIFRRRGGLWQIRFAGQNDFYLPDRKGAEYLRQLLLSPGEPLEIFDIVARSSAQVCNELMTTHEAIDSGLTIKNNALLTSIGKISDWEAIKEYRAEVQRLLTEKEKAKAENNTVELAQIEENIAYIVRQIDASVNIHGKLTTTGDTQRHLRDMFRKNIRRFIAEIAKTDSNCAHHFEKALIYGNQPAYRPDEPTHWETVFIVS